MDCKCLRYFLGAGLIIGVWWVLYGGKRNGCCDRISRIQQLNQRLYPLLNSLMETTYFRHVKLDLDRECPFWDANALCGGANCSVNTWKGISLEEIKFPFFEKESIFRDSHQSSSMNFILLEDQDTKSGVYIDLVENPERFTGYGGKGANIVWEALYSQFCRNCTSNGLVSNSSECKEQVAFCQVLSGLHSSVSIHLSYRHLNKTTGMFSPDAQSYFNRVGNYPERLKNFHLAYMVLIRALQKSSPYFSTFGFNTGNTYDDQKTRDLLRQVASFGVTCPNLFNEKSLFTGNNAKGLKLEFQNHFRNISRIMDCVVCRNCRLWGKIQTMGIGTALKILFSYSEDDCSGPGRPCSVSLPTSSYPIVGKGFDYRLTKIEVVSLFNTIGRFSDSLEYTVRFNRTKSEWYSHLHYRYIIIVMVVVLAIWCVRIFVARRPCLCPSGSTVPK